MLAGSSSTLSPPFLLLQTQLVPGSSGVHFLLQGLILGILPSPPSTTQLPAGAQPSRHPQPLHPSIYGKTGPRLEEALADAGAQERLGKV